MSLIEARQDVAWNKELHRQLNPEDHKFRSAIARLFDVKESSGRWFLGGLGVAIFFRNPWVKLAGLLTSGIGVVKTTTKAFESSPH